MAEQSGTLQLTENDVTLLLTLLRNATSPMSTEDLVAALRERNA